MSGFYQNWIKVQNPNLPNDIPPMESGGYQTPFYFGGSQVPVNLGIDNSIEGGGLHKTNFKPHVKGLKVPPIQVNRHSNIMIPRHLSSIDYKY